MKTDYSIKAITIAAINRAIMNPEDWLFSVVCLNNDDKDFLLEENELPIFKIVSSEAKTLITTRRILEKSQDSLHSILFEEVNEVIWGNFKMDINKPELSKFTVVDMYENTFYYQMETGKASVGLIKAQRHAETANKFL